MVDAARKIKLRIPCDAIAEAVDEVRGCSKRPPADNKPPRLPPDIIIKRKSKALWGHELAAVATERG
jgi:hypothetical protein